MRIEISCIKRGTKNFAQIYQHHSLLKYVLFWKKQNLFSLKHVFSLKNVINIHTQWICYYSKLINISECLVFVFDIVHITYTRKSSVRLGFQI